MFRALRHYVMRRKMRRFASLDKSFHGELDNFNRKIERGENFALVRFAERDIAIIDGQRVEICLKRNDEHRFLPGNQAYELHREILHESFILNANNYFVGIQGPDDVGPDRFFTLKAQSQQPEERLTWSSVFAYSNLPRVKRLTVPILANRRVFLVAHESARPEGLAFSVEKVFAVGGNAWFEDFKRVEAEMLDIIRGNNIHDAVFVFCAGSLSNMLVSRLVQQIPDNTYINMGGVFDVELGLGKTRQYLRKNSALKKQGVWL